MADNWTTDENLLGQRRKWEQRLRPKEEADELLIVHFAVYIGTVQTPVFVELYDHDRPLGNGIAIAHSLGFDPVVTYQTSIDTRPGIDLTALMFLAEGDRRPVSYSSAKAMYNHIVGRYTRVSAVVRPMRRFWKRMMSGRDE